MISYHRLIMMRRLVVIILIAVLSKFPIRRFIDVLGERETGGVLAITRSSIISLSMTILSYLFLDPNWHLLMHDRSSQCRMHQARTIILTLTLLPLFSPLILVRLWYYHAKPRV
jgi:hypothetical protein